LYDIIIIIINEMMIDCNFLLPHRKVHPRVLMKSKREKLESRFILDVTVLDGTLMAPSTKFTKIWRMHNNGSITWPLGTQLIWVGGDHFALHTSVPLEVTIHSALI
jgi:next to BRCA1 gene 1 protein